MREAVRPQPRSPNSALAITITITFQLFEPGVCTKHRHSNLLHVRLRLGSPP
jgi:hypothetical protein